MNTESDGGDIPLVDAVRQCDTESFYQALQAGADVNTESDGGAVLNTESDGGNMPLMDVVRQYDQESFYQTLQTGADVNTESDGGDIPLVDAARKCDQESVCQVLQTGADVNTESDGGGIPMMDAVRQCDQESVYQLLQTGADVNMEAADGTTALIMAARGTGSRKNLIHCIRMLFRAGAHVNRTSSRDGLNALETYLSQAQYVNKSVAMLLFAGGETVDGDKVGVSKVPEYLQESHSESLYLMNICRDRIRRHLLQMSPVNLFVQVPRLGLAPLFTDCLLYWRSLWTVKRKKVPFRRSSSARTSIDL